MIFAHLDGAWTVSHVVQHVVEGTVMTVVEAFVAYTVYEAWHDRSIFDRWLR